VVSDHDNPNMKGTFEYFQVIFWGEGGAARPTRPNKKPYPNNPTATGSSPAAESTASDDDVERIDDPKQPETLQPPSPPFGVFVIVFILVAGFGVVAFYLRTKLWSFIRQAVTGNGGGGDSEYEFKLVNRGGGSVDDLDDFDFDDADLEGLTEEERERIANEDF
jgi:hypothetical protein